MRIPIVNEEDREVSVKERNEVTDEDIYRTAALWLTNSAGDILLAQRALSKRKSPGLWGPAASGTVEEGETYDTNIVKEIQEEIGISLSIDELTRGPKFFIDSRAERSRFFIQWYFRSTDIPIEEVTVQREEVAEIQWVRRAELETWYTNRPEDFLLSAPQWLPQLLAHTRSNLVP